MAKRHPSLHHLSRQHHHALALALRLQQGTRALLNEGWTHDPVEQRHRALRFYREELQGHFFAEENVLFPLATNGAPRSGPAVLALVEQHRELELLASGLGETSREALPEALRHFGALLERHIRTEEREFFPLCEHELTRGVLGVLGSQLDEALDQYQRRHRRAIYARARRVINAPIARLFTTVRDLRRYHSWWPGKSGIAQPGIPTWTEVTLPLGPLDVHLAVSEVQEGRSLELIPVAGAGYVRWTITDHYGGRAVDLEVNVDPLPRTTPEIGTEEDIEGRLVNSLEAALEALERATLGQ